MSSDDARARRRALAKLHHPDRGGDPAAFDRAMRSFDAPPRAEHDIVFTPSARTRLRRTAAATRQTVRQAVATRAVRLARLTRRAP